MDFRQSPFIFALGAVVVVFVLGQSLFFLIRAWKHGRALGMPVSTLRNTVTSSALFTVAPSIAMAATVLALSNSLGLALPWIRMNFIGSFTYETTAATAAAEGLGIPGGIGAPITDPTSFSAIAWVMTIGSVFSLVLLPLFLKKIQAKVSQAVEKKGNAAWTDLISAAAFIGLIAAFVARAIAGQGEADRAGDGAGVLSVLTLVTAIVVMLLLELLVNKKGWKWAEAFTMPLSMFAAMGAAVLFARILPEHIAFLEWRG